MRVDEAEALTGCQRHAIGLSLTQGTSIKLPASKPWCVASPEALASAGLAPGATILVGVTNQSVGGPAKPGGTPMQMSPAGVSSFAPVNSPDLRGSTVHLIPLIKHLAQSSNIEFAQSEQLKDCGNNTAALIGQHLVAAQVWPSSKLPRGLVCISSALAEMCGRPAAGSVLALLPAHLNSMHEFTTTSTPDVPVRTIQVCGRAHLRLMYDSLRCQPATLAPVINSTPAASTTSVASTPTRLNSRSGSKATPTASRTAGTPPSSKGRSVAGSEAGAETLQVSQQLGDWVLSLLHPKPGTASGRAGQGAALQQNACLDPRQRQLISSVIISRLAGCCLIQGNPVPVPLLGHTLVCEVEGLWGVSSADHPAQQIKLGLIQPGTTTLTLLLQGEQAEQWASPQPAVASTAAQDVVSMMTSSRAGASAVPVGRGLAELVAAARRAAEEAAGEGGSAEAAAAAAERAVRSGWSAAGLNYSSLGGISHLVSALRELVTLPLRGAHLFKSFKVRPPRGVLLHGPPGSGKTVLARAAAGDAGATLLVVNGPDVMSEFMGESEAGLAGVFAAARHLSPSIIFIDEIDAIAPARGGGAGDGGAASVLGGAGGGADTASRVVTTLLMCMDGAGGTGPGDGVVVLGATNRPAALDAALRRPGRLERELEVGPPPPDARLHMLQTRLKTVAHCLSDEELLQLADSAHGFVAADIAALANEAALSALRRHVAGGHGHQDAHQAADQTPQVVVDLRDFQLARTRVTPSALRDLAVEVPRVTWADVGGLQDVKHKLQEAVIWPFKSPAVLSRLGAVPPRGVLLFGPPGCSKTLLAKVVAAEAKLNFISIKGGELFSKYVGESEKAVAALFARARATAPAIIFFDEIDSLATSRSAEGGGAHIADRVMAQLLTEMDGLQQRLGVVVLAATNRPDCIDTALLRPGRFDRLVYVPPPDAEARAEILKIHLRKVPIGTDVDITQVAQACAGFSGADLGALVREAGLSALEEDLEIKQVFARHFTAAQARVVPSATPSQHMQQVYEQFSSGAQSIPTQPVFNGTTALSR